MRKPLLILLFVAGLLVSCDFERMREEREISRRALDSLRTELLTHQKLTETLMQVGDLLDSIDITRNAVRTGILEGAPQDAYASRLRDINRHIRNTEQKVASLEKSLQKARKAGNATYQTALNKMKSELDIRNHELKALQEQLGYYKTENEQLVNTVGHQKAELDERMNQLKQKQLEAEGLDAQVKQLVVQAKVDQGDALYLRALAVEETANRTHFAPRKKKATRKQALELYRLALVCGKTEAQTRIDHLQSLL